MYQGHALKQSQQSSHLNVVDANSDNLVKMAMDKDTDNITILKCIVKYDETMPCSKLVNKAIELIQCFRNCLNQSCGSDIDNIFEVMYEHLGFMLFQAISQNNVEALDKVGYQLNHMQQLLNQILREDSLPAVSTVEPNSLGLQKSISAHI